MKRSVALFLALFLATSQAFQTTPVLVWSERDFGKETLSQTITTEDLSQLLSSVHDANSDAQSPFAVVNLRNTVPEVVVVYLQSQLRTDEIQSNVAAFAPLKQLLANAKSSVLAPWMQITAEQETTDSAVIAATQKYAKVFLVSTVQDSPLMALLDSADHSVQRVSQADLGRLSIFNNGVSDLVFVELADSDFGGNNAKIVEIDNLIKSKTSNYVAIYTAQTTTPVGINFEMQPVDTAIEQNIFKRYVFESLQDNNGTNSTDPTAPTPAPSDGDASDGEDWTVWFPYWFWEGLIFGILFVWIAVCGSCLLMSVQTHDRYLTETKLKLT